MAPGLDRAPVAGVQRLDRVRGAQHLADLDVVVEERDELLPGVFPQADDRPVAGTPGLGELVERGPGGISVHRRVDRLDVALERVPVPLGGQVEGVADQVHDAGLHDRLRPGVAHHLGQALQPVADHEEHVPDAPVPQVRQHAHPELGALPAGPGPQAQDVLLTSEGDADGSVDRPVGDLPVPHLDHDRVDEDGRVDLIERTLLPGLHLLDHLVGDPADGLLAAPMPRRSRRSAR